MNGSWFPPTERLSQSNEKASEWFLTHIASPMGRRSEQELMGPTG
jgi:hypothetical protein